MNKEELSAIIDQKYEDIKSGLVAKDDELQEQMTFLQTEMEKLDVVDELSSKLDELTEAAEKQGETLAKMNKTTEKQTKGIAEQLSEKMDDLKRVKKSGGFVDLSLKGEINRSDIATDYMGYFVPGVGEYQRRMPFIRQLFAAGSVGANSHGKIYYTDNNAITNGATRVAESGAYPTSSDITWKGYDLDLEKVADSIKMSEEAMLDVDFIESETRNILMRNLMLKVDNYLTSGTGSSQPFGVETRATAFAAGTYANKYKDANLMDLIRVCGTLINTASNYSANYVLLNPADAEIYLYGKKDDNNNYIIPQNGGMVGLVNGLMVVTNSGITANTMVVGDFSRGTVYSGPEGVKVEVGRDSDDFTNDLFTLKVRERIQLLIREADIGAFRYVSDIASAITAITEVVD